MTPPPVLDILADLVRINSVNPAYEGGVSEAAVAAYARDFFTAHGIECREQEVFPGRPNLIARLAGRDPGRRIVFEAHSDTASVAGMSIPPFQPEVREGRLYGRGSCDTKAGLAAMMHALAALAAGERPSAEIWVVAAADEEFSFRGVLKLCEGLKAAGGVVSEPTSMRLITATKGCLRFRVHTRGRAAHSSKPHLGVNAISRMTEVARAIERDAAGLAARSHPLLGHATSNIGLIRGGTQVNMVPDACTIDVDRRLLPGEEPAAILNGYRRLVEALKVDASLEMTLEDNALETPPDARVAATAASVLAALGLDPAPAGVPYGSDASKLSRAGIPSIVIGPGSIDQAHAAVEWVDTHQVKLAAEFYRRMMLAF